MYKLYVHNHKPGDYVVQEHGFDTLEQTQMCMLSDMCCVQMEYGADWAQAGMVLLELLRKASLGELHAEMHCDDVPGIVVSPYCGMVYGCGAAVSYVITEE